MPSKKIIDLEGLKKFRQETDQKYVIEGEYSPTTSVGKADVADNLTPYGPNSGADQDTPFVFQSSGAGSDIGSIAQLRELRGNSVVWNQLVDTYTSQTTQSGVVVTASNNGRKIELSGSASGYFALTTLFNKTIQSEHKVLIKGKFVNSSEISNSELGFRIRTASELDITVQLNEQNNFNYIYTTGKDDIELQLFGPNSGDFTGISFEDIQIFDLTQMFGAGNEPTSVLEFNRLFPKAYYSYNAGELLSCKSSSYKIVGYNQFDELLTMNKRYNSSTGELENQNSYCCSTNYIKVISGQKYTIEASLTGYSFGYIIEYDENQNFIKSNYFADSYILDQKSFTLTDNTHYITITLGNSILSTTDASICFHLTWDGSKTGYEPYTTKSYSLPNIELRKAGSVYDTITPNGTLTRRVGVIDLGTLNWYPQSSYTAYSASIQSLIKAPSTYTEKANILCSKYEASSEQYINNDLIIAISTTGAILINDGSLSGQTAEQIKTALSGAYLFYELATPTTEQVAPFVENQAIDDFGTQEFVSSENIVVPQGCYFFYPVDYKAFIDSLGERNDIDYDASKVVSQTQLQTAISQIPTPDLTSISSNVSPSATSTYDLGSSSYSWKDLYLSGNIDFGDGAKISKDSSNRIDFTYNNDSRLKIGNGNLNIKARLDPDSNATYDIGRSGVAWRDLYLTRYITDGANSVNVADISNGIIKFLNAPASGIPDELNSALLNGNICYVNGNSSNTIAIMKYGCMLFPTKGSTDEAWGIGFYYKQANHEKIELFQYRQGIISHYNWVGLSNIESINGKIIPAYPSNTGTFVLKCVDGVLTWVQE